MSTELINSVLILAHPCSKCGAEQGKHCVTPTGAPANLWHAARKQAAADTLALFEPDNYPEQAGAYLRPEEEHAHD